MAKVNDTPELEIVHPVCCGMDVHKKSVSACLITVNNSGEAELEVRKFGTFTDELLELKQWLISNKCPIAGDGEHRSLLAPCSQCN